MAERRELDCGVDLAFEVATDAMENTDGIERIVTDGEEIWGITGYNRGLGIIPTLGSIVIARVGDAADPPEWPGLDQDNDSTPVTHPRSFTSLAEDDDEETEEAEEPDREQQIERKRARLLGKHDNSEVAENEETSAIYVKSDSLANHQYKSPTFSLSPDGKYRSRYLNALDSAAANLERYDGETDPLVPSAYPNTNSVRHLVFRRELLVWFIGIIILIILPSPNLPAIIGVTVGVIVRSRKLE